MSNETPQTPGFTPLIEEAIERMARNGASPEEVAAYLNEVVGWQTSAPLTEDEAAEIDRTGDLHLYVTPSDCLVIKRRAIEMVVDSPMPKSSVIAERMLQLGVARLHEAGGSRRRLLLDLDDEEITRLLHGNAFYVAGIWNMVSGVEWVPA